MELIRRSLHTPPLPLTQPTYPHTHQTHTHTQTVLLPPRRVAGRRGPPRLPQRRARLALRLAGVGPGPDAGRVDHCAQRSGHFHPARDGAFRLVGWGGCWVVASSSRTRSRLSHRQPTTPQEHDLIHDLYFKRQKWVQDAMFAFIWIIKSNANPWCVYIYLPWRARPAPHTHAHTVLDRPTDQMTMHAHAHPPTRSNPKPQIGGGGTTTCGTTSTRGRWWTWRSASSGSG